MELESLIGCEFMRRTTGERKTIKTIWKCYFCEEMVVNLHLLARQTLLGARWRAIKRELMAAALMPFCISTDTMRNEIRESINDIGSLIAYQHFWCRPVCLFIKQREKMKRRSIVWCCVEMLATWGRNPAISGLSSVDKFGGSSLTVPFYPFIRLSSVSCIGNSLLLSFVCVLSQSTGPKGRSPGVNML